MATTRTSIRGQVRQDGRYALFDFGSGDEGLETSVIARSLNFLGAFSAVVLIAGLTWWGYQLLMRDVTGVPVVRALEGPARVQPDKPGGQLAEHQGLAVNAVQADAELQDATSEITMAPPPIDLAAEDAILPDADAEEITAIAPQPAVQRIAPETTSAVDAAIALALSGDDSAPEGQADVVPASVSGVTASPRPGLRPRINLAAFRRASQTDAVLASAQIELDPAAITPGTRLVQLGAFDNREKAIAEWTKIALQFNDYMEGKSRVVQEAQSGGRKFYRLRAAGFEDMAASRRFCSVLMAQNAACIPVAAR